MANLERRRIAMEANRPEANPPVATLSIKYQILHEENIEIVSVKSKAIQFPRMTKSARFATSHPPLLGIIWEKKTEEGNSIITD